MQEQEVYNTNRKNINLKDFLEYLGYDVIPHGRGRHKLREHDSLIIQGSRFFWNSKNLNGNYFELLKALEGYDKEQIFDITQNFLDDIYEEKYIPSENIKAIDKEQNKERYQPAKYKKNEKIFEYLVDKRKINRNIVEGLINSDLIYMDNFNNINFYIKDKVGNKLKDENGYYATDVVGTGIKFKRNTSTHYGFNMSTNKNDENIEKLYIFESTIDMLSFIDLKNSIENSSWDKNIRLLSLSGLRKDILENYLDDNIKNLYVCLDNDEAGENTFNKIKENYSNVKIHRLRSFNKDWNEDLQNLNKNIDVDKIKNNFKGEINMSKKNKKEVENEVVENEVGVNVEENIEVEKKSAIQVIAESKEKLIDKMISNINEGKIWDENSSIKVFAPTNALTGREYEGFNRFAIAMYLTESKIIDNRILTQSQIKANDLYVVKGSENAKVSYKNNDNNKLSYRNIYSVTKVYAHDKENDIKNSFVNTLHDKKEVKDIIEDIKKASGIKVFENSSDKAFYSSKDNYISIPNMENCKNENEYLDNLLHATIRSTAKECNRFVNKDTFIKEELITEYSKLIIESELGIDLRKDSTTFEKNKENIEEWISYIDKDLVNRVMGSVMIESSKAAEYVIDKYKEVVKAKENTNDIKESSWDNRKKDSEMER